MSLSKAAREAQEYLPFLHACTAGAPAGTVTAVVAALHGTGAALTVVLAYHRVPALPAAAGARGLRVARFCHVVRPGHFVAHSPAPGRASLVVDMAPLLRAVGALRPLAGGAALEAARALVRAAYAALDAACGGFDPERAGWLREQFELTYLYDRALAAAHPHPLGPGNAALTRAADRLLQLQPPAEATLAARLLTKVVQQGVAPWADPALVAPACCGAARPPAAITATPLPPAAPTATPVAAAVATAAPVAAVTTEAQPELLGNAPTADATAECPAATTAATPRPAGGQRPRSPGLPAAAVAWRSAVPAATVPPPPAPQQPKQKWWCDDDGLGLDFTQSVLQPQVSNPPAARPDLGAHFAAGLPLPARMVAVPVARLASAERLAAPAACEAAAAAPAYPICVAKRPRRRAGENTPPACSQ